MSRTRLIAGTSMILLVCGPSAAEEPRMVADIDPATPQPGFRALGEEL